MKYINTEKYNNNNLDLLNLIENENLKFKELKYMYMSFK